MDLTLPMVGLLGLSFLSGAACLFGAIARPRVRKQLAATSVVAGVLALGVGYILTSGVVIAADWRGKVTRAALVGSAATTEMRRIGPLLYGVPRGETGLHVTYADGRTGECGYFDGMPSWVDTAWPLTC